MSFIKLIHYHLKLERDLDQLVWKKWREIGGRWWWEGFLDEVEEDDERSEFLFLPLKYNEEN